MDQDAIKEFTSTGSPVCTSVCTSEAENANDDAPDAIDQDADRNESGSPLGPAELAAALAALSPTDRAKLAAMIAGKQAEGAEP